MPAKREKLLFSPDEILAHVQSGVTSALSASLAHGLHDERDQSFVISQMTDLSKKFVSSQVDLDELSLNAFIAFEDMQACMRRVNNLPFPNPAFPVGLDYTSRCLLKARAIVHRVLGDFDEDEWFDSCRHSSGSSIGVPYQDTSPEAKFRGLSATAGVDRWFGYYLQYDGTLSKLLGNKPKVKIVRGSRAATVPKDNKKVRMICIEPTLNMFFQQGLMDVITARLEQVGISFSVQQEVNRERAFLSSLSNQDATIDWSAASDSVSLSLVQFLFPREWFYYLDTFRCREMEILGQYMHLESFSTMGNATTFPVETLVFWSIAQAVVDTSKSTLGPEEFSPRVQVFGDDCILPGTFASSYIQVMSRLGFRPNLDKTFLDGRFRESCGGDFLAGRDVRPYYLTGPSGGKLTHLHAWLNIIFNRLFNRCIRIWGPLRYVYAGHAIFDCLFSLYRVYKLEINIVPTHYPDDAGLKIGIDLFRFLRTYRVRDLLSPISVDTHGTFYFRYLTAEYRTKYKIDPKIRLWMALKGLSQQSPRFVKVRKKLNYTAAKGTSPFFVLNKDGKH